MNITVVGAGYVGLVTGTCLAELGNEIMCVDIDKEKIAKLKKGISPIFEPGLEELIKRNIKGKRLFFEVSLNKALKNSAIVFIAVGTPSKKNGEVDLRYVEAVAKEIGKNMDHYLIVVNKSTVPIGTGDFVSKIIGKYYKSSFDVVSNPEFLREGSAVLDFMNPDRIVIGYDPGSKKPVSIMQKLYKPLNCKIIFTDLKSAEMIKYASNAFLGTHISFINTIANICEKVGADIESVSEGMRLDKRIGKNAFLDAGLGYGGSCFPKDIKALINIGKKNGVKFGILEMAEKVNEMQKISIVEKLKKVYPSLKKRKIAVWGLAFKPQTDDMREAPSIPVIQTLQKGGATIHAFDPVALKNAKKVLKNVKYFDIPFDAAKGCDALLIITKWPEFKQIDKIMLRSKMKNPVIVDGRNTYDMKEMEELGFVYLSVGREAVFGKTMERGQRGLRHSGKSKFSGSKISK